MSCEADFNNLRHKLDVLGYRQPLPISAISLVNALVEDLLKTTESLRDSKLQIGKLLEEKSCWELGVEPYKCDNSRLLAECNELHLELLKQKEEYEERICDLIHKIRDLELDKGHLQEHCIELENQIRDSLTRQPDSKNFKNKKDGANMNKRPFISTVRSGVIIPPNPQNQQLPAKCGKCHATINWSKLSVINAHDIEKLQNDVKEQSDLINLYKKKIEARDREIDRLNDLLSGGRPAAALAKDCCYKDVGTLSEDVEMLQQEKIENLRKIHEYQSSMHEAMERAVDLVEKNKCLQDELEEFKKTALDVEEQANREIAGKNREIDELKRIIQKLEKEIRCLETNNATSDSDYHRSCKVPFEDKRKLHERLNELTVREQELRAENDRLNQKYVKVKTKLSAVQRDTDEKSSYKADKSIATTIDEEKIRLKSERDFFQKEYLRLLEKTGSEKEICFLQSQINAKDNELKALRSELAEIKLQQNAQINENIMSTASTTKNACVQATILRVERERDIIKTELERVKCERDALREKLLTNAESKVDEVQKYEENIKELKSIIRELEKSNRELSTSQIPQQTQITLMKEEIDELKKRIFELQSENNHLSTSYNQLKILHEQTEKSLVMYQNKLHAAETQLETEKCRSNTLGTSRDTSRNEISALKKEIALLKSTNVSLEHEKDKIVSELDLKTEKLYLMESDLKGVRKKIQELERQIDELQCKLSKATSEKRERESELHETSHESQTLRKQISVLKASRDQAIHENGQISAELADVQAELCLLRRKFKDSEKEIERLKQQSQQYMLKVQRAEELLFKKEKEREQMLEQYRSLSHDAIVLEGNNQSLEVETAEQKRLLDDAESEIRKLRQEIATKDEIIEKLENQIATLSAQISHLEKELEQAYNDQRLLKVDLDAMKELCDKLDLQRDKLNAELNELQDIRSKLEEENDRLRTISTDITGRTNNQLTVDSLQDLLSSSRRELEMQRSSANQMSKEMTQLKKKVDQLQLRLNDQSDKASKSEALAREYSVQVQEMQHTLTDDRFKRTKSSDTSPRYHPTI